MCFFLAQIQIISSPIVKLVTLVFYMVGNIMPMNFLLLKYNIKARVILLLGSIKAFGTFY